MCNLCGIFSSDVNSLILSRLIFTAGHVAQWQVMETQDGFGFTKQVAVKVAGNGNTRCFWFYKTSGSKSSR